MAALFGAGPAADFPADYQVAKTAFRSVIVRGRLRVRHEDKQFLDVPLNPPAELGLHRQRVFQERLAQRQ